ncbi:BREX system ATP-binding domain-containing protein [Desulforhabdus sp. TSK]|uniref:BREX system ATP-binding domain-containing protein n=1 Tax=Desulforhabdus sp. TSK TaxID=2925014 RepID=UPI001FC8069D|nr:BREX system ATP-binding domain-containing protein [Desulforhabdus sp. TSK]GKT08955.1 hypothetical protein DSTSK_22600 [Desulforhabdus sp. TSK]
MIPKDQLDALKPFQARAIIEELRKGSVPMDYVPFFTVGRENWLTFIEDDLDHYIAEGGAKVRFINGDYGDGKTHFMSVIRHMALDKGFAVSFVVLSREVPMQKFEVVYREIIRQLRVPAYNNPKDILQGIRSLLDAWVSNFHSDAHSNESPGLESTLLEKLRTTDENIRALAGMETNFANGLMSLLENRWKPLQEGETEEDRTGVRELLYQWFEGEKVAKKDLKPFQIFESLNKTNSKRLFSSLVAFLRYLGCKGLILLLDELESVITQSTSVRNTSFENVRLLIDNTEQAQHLHIFFSIIPDVLLSEKGFKSYDALWSRVRSIGEGKRLNYRSILIDLHKTPLETAELIELGLILRRIHEISYRWDAKELVKESLLEQLCLYQKQMGLLSEVRLFIKGVIRVLDMAEQGEAPEESLDLKEQILSSRREVEQEKMEQLQPKWDD